MEGTVHGEILYLVQIIRDKKVNDMKCKNLFSIILCLLIGCSSSAVIEPTSMDETHSAVAPLSSTPTIMTTSTSTPTPNIVLPTVMPTGTKCTYSNGLIILPGGEEEFAAYHGWSSSGEYYVGATFPGKIVFCYLEKDFTGTITQFDYSIDFYAKNVSDQILDDIGREGVFQVFPNPDGKRYLYIKVADPPRLDGLNRYEIWIWDSEKQQTSLLSGAEEEFWRKCGGFLPPEEVSWLDKNLLFVNCQIGDVPDYFLVDIQKKVFVSIGDKNCYWNEFFRGYTFSPDGKQHLSVALGGNIDNFSINPLLIAYTKDTLQYIRQCTETGDRYAGLSDFMQQTKEIPYEVFVIPFLNGVLPTVRWSADSNFLYLIDIDSEHGTYGDILKYHLNNGKAESFVEFEHLKGIFPDIKENAYYFNISPSEEYVLIGFPQGALTKIRLEDLR